MFEEKIDGNLKSALKEGRELEVSVLRLLKASVLNKEKDKRYKLKLEKDSALTDEEVLDVISSEIKKRKESIELYDKGNRPELAEKEKKEMEILQAYLPEQLSEEEVKKIVADAVLKTGAKEIKEMGRVMTEVSPQLKGKADMSVVSKIVKDILS